MKRISGILDGGCNKFRSQQIDSGNWSLDDRITSWSKDEAKNLLVPKTRLARKGGEVWITS